MLGPRSMGTSMGAGTLRDPDSPPFYGGERSSGADRRGGGGWVRGERGGSRGARGANLQHRTSAKRLIDRYEQLSTPPPHTPPGAGGASLTRNKSTYSRQYVYDYRTAFAASNYLATPEQEEKKRYGFGGKKDKDKDRSPIRQSLRNLLSVIKRGAGGLTKRKSDDKLGVPYSATAVGPGAGGARRAKERLEEQPPNPLLRPRKRMTGSLLYLTLPQPLSPDHPNAHAGAGAMTWTSCTVTLDANKLVLSSFTADMELHVHEIMLSHCADIRSLSTAQLSAEEARLLEEAALHLEVEKGGLKVFEVLFEGRAREKFAAKSVRERAGWISAIWDAILPQQEAKGHPVENDGPLPEIPKRSEYDNYNVKPIESPIPTPILKMSSLLTSSSCERSLPPLPPEPSVPPAIQTLSIPERANNSRKPPNLHLDLSEISGPISPSIYPPTSQASSPVNSPLETPKKNLNLHIDTTRLTSPVSLSASGVGAAPFSASTYPPTSRPGSIFAASPTGSSCPNSPSITNLSQLSVVRQRLAQIERNHSQLSEQSGFSGLATRPSTPVRSPMSPSGWSRREAVFHNARASPTPTTTSKPMSPTASKDCGDLPVTRRKRMHRKETSSIPRQNKHGDNKTPESETLAPSKEDILELFKGLADIKGVLGGESGYPTIHQVVVKLDHRIQGDGQALRTMQDRLDLLGDRVTNAIAVAASSAASNASTHAANASQQPTSDSNETVVRALEEVKSRLATDFPALACKIQEIRDVQEKERKEVKEKNEEVAYHNIGRSKVSENSDSKPVDLQPVLDKLEDLRKLCEPPPKAEHLQEEQKVEAKPPQHLEKILALIQEDSNKQTLLSQQQADSVRYLNELNTWLEAFVNNGTSQIQGLSANVDQLCRNLGCNPQPPGGPHPPEGDSPNLLNDIRQLVLGMQARDQNFAALQAAVHSLLEVLTASQTQMGADSQAIAGLIDQQRRDQEILFRTFTNEISGEIKGERLRFVEAMKEATAINVQIHVEQFKQELSKEVMSMTEEVGRLHREKQLVENQISDLFAFYSKHKQAETPLQMVQSNIVVAPVRQSQDRPRANIPRSHHRPLPYPHQ